MTHVRILALVTVSYHLLAYCEALPSCIMNVPENPPSPSNLALGSYSESSVVLSWSPVMAPEDCIPLYSIMTNTSESPAPTMNTQVQLNVVLLNNEPSTKYCVKVATTIGVNKGVYSDPICFILDVPAPLELHINDDGGGDFTLSWTSDQDDRPPITNYYISLLDAFSKVLLSGMLPGSLMMTSISQSMIPNNNNVTTVTVTLIAENVLGNNTGSEINITLGSSSSSSIAASTTTKMAQIATSMTPVVVSSTSTVGSTSTILTSMSSSTKPLLPPSTISTESTVSSTSSLTTSYKGTRTTSSVISPAGTISETAAPSATSTGFQPSSSVISTISTTSSSSSSLVAPVIGGVVGGLLLLFVIVVVLIVMSYVIRVKTKSKAYAIQTLEAEAVKTGPITVYKEVGEHTSNDTRRGGSGSHGNGSSAEPAPPIPMRHVSLGPRALSNGSTVATTSSTEISEQRETSTSQLLPREQATYQDPKSIRRETATSTGSIYTVPQKNIHTTQSESVVRASDRVDYADLSFSQANTRQQQPSRPANNAGDYDDVMAVNSSVHDRVEYSDLNFRTNSNTAASRHQERPSSNINPMPPQSADEDYDDVMSVCKN